MIPQILTAILSVIPKIWATIPKEIIKIIPGLIIYYIVSTNAVIIGVSPETATLYGLIGGGFVSSALLLKIKKPF